MTDETGDADTPGTGEVNGGSEQLDGNLGLPRRRLLALGRARDKTTNKKEGETTMGTDFIDIGTDEIPERPNENSEELEHEPHDEYQGETEINPHHPAWTILATVIDVLIVTVIVTAIEIFLVTLVVPFSWLLTIVLGGSSLVLSSFKLLNVSWGTIPIGHQGELLLFGKRVGLLFHEGVYLNTIYHGFATEAIKDVRESVVKFESLSVNMGGSATEEGAKEGTKLRIEIKFIGISIDYRITNLSKYLNVKDFVEQLKNFTKSAIRILLEKSTEDEVFEGGGKFTKDIAEEIREAAESLGAWIIRVNISDSEYANAELKIAQEKRRISAIKNTVTIDAAKAINKSVETVKGDLDISDSEALTTIRLERETQTLEEVLLSGKNGSDIITAAKILAGGKGG